jgi:hypothetical protein
MSLSSLARLLWSNGGGISRGFTNSKTDDNAQADSHNGTNPERPSGGASHRPISVRLVELINYVFVYHEASVAESNKSRCGFGPTDCARRCCTDSGRPEHPDGMSKKMREKVS